MRDVKIKIKVGLAALATALVGFTATAYAGALPGRGQQLAHNLIGAPPPGNQHGSPATRTSPPSQGRRGTPR
jgi:hypothetical protein